MFSTALFSHAGLIGHWDFEEGSGLTTADKSGGNHTGTLGAGATWSTTEVAPVPSGSTASIAFDGSDLAHVIMNGYKASEVGGTNSRTLAAWIKSAPGVTPIGANLGIFGYGANVAGQKWNFRTQDGNGPIDGNIRVEVNGGYIIGTTVVIDNTWHHVAMTWEDDGSPNVTDVKLYVDGVLEAVSASLDEPVNTNTTTGIDLAISDDHSQREWNGWLDDIRIYDEVLDEAEIAALAMGTPILSSFTASEDVVAGGSPVVLSWVSDPANDSLVIDNEVGDVSGSTMITVNPTATTTYTLTGTRGGETLERKITVLVDSGPLVNLFVSVEGDTVMEGQSALFRWDVFGQTSLSINGIDVTGLNFIDLFPAETTTYTFTATNAFGSTSSELTITVIDGSNPDLSWDAAGLPEGPLAQWDPAINTTGNNGMTFVSNTGGAVQTGTSNFTGISSWVNSPGYNLTASTVDSWQDHLGDSVTKADVSWEMVVRPGDFTGTHVLFNTGGNGDGTAIVLTDSTIDFRVQTADDDDSRIIISTDLATLGNATDFFHLVATLDVDLAKPGTATLYVNGQSAVSASSTATLDDWDGADLAELGKGANIPTSTTFPFEAFTGDIALFNYYGTRVLNASQVAALFDEVSGGAGGLAITEVDYDLTSGEIRLTFKSIPGRAYALESTLDLSAVDWVEIDDSILADDTETTVVLTESTLTDPGSVRRFFRIRPGVQ